MRFVITNDDGIDEPGLRELERACRTLGDVVVVAPVGPQSGVSHCVTDSGELVVEERGPGRFAVHGTPADCARLALRHLAPDAGWLVAGINAGANLGMDVHVSGTVAAAREAAIHGVPALALSQYRRPFAPIGWPAARARAQRVLREVLARRLEPGDFWNANLPHPHDEAVECEIVDCRLDPSPAGHAFERTPRGFACRGDYHGRPRRARHDIDVCFGGRIALTRLHIASRTTTLDDPADAR